MLIIIIEIYNAQEEDKVLAVLVTCLDAKPSLNFQMPCLQMINNIKCATIRSGK